jgi:NADH-quinone oxidoreductase subunit L
MTLPLIVLALGAVFAGYLGVPEGLTGGRVSNYFEHLLEPSIAHAPPSAEHAAPQAHGETTQSHEQVAEDHGMELTLTVVSVIIALAGMALGWVWFNRKPLWQPPRLLEEKYYVDEVYDAAIIQPIKVGSTRVLWKFIDVGIIDGAVNGAGRLASMFGGTIRFLQSGLARSYVAVVVLGALLVIGYFVIK